MLSIATPSILLLIVFSLVRGSDDCHPTCDRKITSTFERNELSGAATCTCLHPSLSYCNSDVLGTKDVTGCRQYCCANCPPRSQRSLQLKAENSTSIEESNHTITPAHVKTSENDTSSNYTPSHPICFCYGAPKEPSTDEPCAMEFESCSETCNTTCSVELGESGDCGVSPLFIAEKGSINETTAENYISVWRASGISGKVCVCKKKGYKLGTGDIADFQEQDCDEFCSQADYFGGVGIWLTTDELASPSPSPSYSSLTQQQPNTPTWAVAFFAAVVCVGFLMITVLFCRPSASR